jgi:hypothetical protein
VRPISSFEPLHRLQPKWYERYATDGRPNAVVCKSLTNNNMGTGRTLLRAMNGPMIMLDVGNTRR